MLLTFSRYRFARLSKRSALIGVAAAAMTAVSLPAPAAQAATSTAACDAAAVSQPFLPWGDANQYGLLAGGDFEGSLSGWTLAGGAHTIAGSEPFAATGKLGALSLDLPLGSSVQTPLTCVDAGTPRFRLFAHNLTPLASVLVQVVYSNAMLSKSPIVVPVGLVAGNATWAPTKSMVTGGTILSLVLGSTAQVSLRFTALGGASQIDDIFVDPRHAK
jgi:hypothetical protein